MDASGSSGLDVRARTSTLYRLFHAHGTRTLLEHPTALLLPVVIALRLVYRSHGASRHGAAPTSGQELTDTNRGHGSHDAAQ